MNEFKSVNGIDHYDVVDFELPMTLSLYNCYGDNVENILTWVPDEPQWWITGFNPSYTEPDPKNMTMVCSVDFSGTNMYDDFKDTYKSDNETIIFDNDLETVWIIW